MTYPPWLRGFVLLGASLAGIAGAFGQSGPFSPSCKTPLYPAPAPSSALGIDAQCGTKGAGAAEANQNAQKNNFCPTSSTPSPVTIADLQKLQSSVDNNTGINFGDENAPPRKRGPTTQRGPLKTLGEGKEVMFQGFVLIARQEGGESVNCAKGVPNQPLFHDIHISLVEAAGAEECSGIVAEMIPHHRPDSWDVQNVLAVSKAQLPVRVTGQLFFDSSHEPCSDGQPVRSNPKRISLWEIHPIYKFEVCTSTGCDSGGTWVTLDDWVKSR